MIYVCIRLQDVSSCIQETKGKKQQQLEREKKDQDKVDFSFLAKQTYGTDRKKIGK